MKPFTKYLRNIFLTAFIGYFLYKIVDHFYYSSFNGNDKIKFATLDTNGIKTFGDIFKKEPYIKKVTLVDLYFQANSEAHKIDLPFFKKLYQKFSNKPFEIVYTNIQFDDSFRNSEQKKLIKKNDIWGIHLTVPQGLQENTTVEHIVDGKQTTTYPKYLLVDKDGAIVDTFAPRPASFARLCIKIDSLLEK